MGRRGLSGSMPLSTATKELIARIFRTLLGREVPAHGQEPPCSVSDVSGPRYHSTAACFRTRSAGSNEPRELALDGEAALGIWPNAEPLVARTKARLRSHLAWSVATQCCCAFSI